MFNIEKLLGGLIRSTTRGTNASSLLKGGAALGLLGVAMEAAEHFMANQNQSTDRRPAPPPPTPPSAQTSPGPPGPSVNPPPPPGAVKQPPPAQAPSPETDMKKGVLLIRAMIAAANADGRIDAAERQQILRKLKSVDLSAEESAFIGEELLNPASPEDIVEQAGDRQLAVQVYAVSLLAIEVDTETEQRCLRNLAKQLELDTQTIRAIEKKLGLEYRPKPIT